MREKSYEELSFTDDFMFCKIMMNNPDLCKQLLEIILQKKIRKIVYQNTQEEKKETWDGKGIRLDVYIEDDENTVYDIEMQANIVADLPKRSRYYQGMIDLSLIEKGARYKELKESYIIFICTFDPFGKNLPLYVFENRCLQNLELSLNDKTKKVFLNPKGDLTLVSPELAEFLKYLSDHIPSGDFTRALQEKVDAAIVHKEWRLEYMTLLQKFNEKYDEGLEQGLKQGIEQGIESGIMALYSLVEDKILTLAEAAKRASMDEKEFLEKVKNYQEKQKK